MDRTQLTDRQAEILEAIQRNPRTSFKELMEEFGINSPNGIMCHVRALEKKGFISRKFKTARSIEVIDQDHEYAVLTVWGRFPIGGTTC